MRTVHWFYIFLSPNTDNVRLFEDLAVIHTQKYSLKLLKSGPSFTLLAWLSPGVCIYAYLQHRENQSSDLCLQVQLGDQFG